MANLGKVRHSSLHSFIQHIFVGPCDSQLLLHNKSPQKCSGLRGQLVDKMNLLACLAGLRVLASGSLFPAAPSKAYSHRWWPGNRWKPQFTSTHSASTGNPAALGPLAKMSHLAKVSIREGGSCQECGHKEQWASWRHRGYKCTTNNYYLSGLRGLATSKMALVELRFV